MPSGPHSCGPRGVRRCLVQIRLVPGPLGLGCSDGGGGDTPPAPSLLPTTLPPAPHLSPLPLPPRHFPRPPRRGCAAIVGLPSDGWASGREGRRGRWRGLGWWRGLERRRAPTLRLPPLTAACGGAGGRSAGRTPPQRGGCGVLAWTAGPAAVAAVVAPRRAWRLRRWTPRPRAPVVGPRVPVTGGRAGCGRRHDGHPGILVAPVHWGRH